MLAGENPSETATKHDSIIKPDLTKLERSNQDSVFKDKLQQEQFNLSVNPTTTPRRGVSNLLFFPPLKGVTTGTFDVATGHYGIDVVGKANSRISSALDGTVIFSEWTMETGYVIMVQHDQNITTVYKHNAELLKKQGDRVRSGEAIAIMGNSGKETTGPHIHFEIWIDGVAVNPAEYVSF
jgi:murein DD-endopeptidase MepM/ murein hydrolase activator NlpD